MSKEETLVKISLAKSGFERGTILDNYAKEVAIGFAEWKDEKYRQLSDGRFWEATEANRNKRVSDLQLYTYDDLYQQYLKSK